MEQSSSSEFELMKSSLRLKEVLRDQSFEDVRTCCQKFKEMRTELRVQRAMLEADSTVLRAMNDAYSRQRGECVRTSQIYFKMS